MEARMVDIEGLFQKPISYRIPQFQRYYAWGEEVQWKPLWEDVRNIAERFLDKEDTGEILPHFMGAIVLQQQPNNTGEVTKRLVIDGQQRLTTLQLLIKATEQVLQSQDDTARATRLSGLLTNSEKHWDGNNENETKIRQSNSDDRGAFRASITNSYSRDRYEDSAISRGYEFFEASVGDWLNREEEDKSDRADALEETLTKYLQIAAIDLNLNEKPHIIFETLNARGEPLKQADLIKNTVMYEANVIDEPQKARELWGMFEDQWWQKQADEPSLKRSHIDRFLHHWMIMRTLREVHMDRVASRFRSYIEQENKVIGSYIEQENEEIEKLAVDIVAEDIRGAGGIYKKLETVNIPEIYTSLKRLKVMKLGAVTPLLLWLFTSDVPEEQRRRSVEALESCLVRRMLCGLNSKVLDKVVVSTLNFLENPDRREVSLEGQYILSRMGIDFMDIDFANPSHIIIMSFALSEQWVSDRKLLEDLTTEQMRGSSTRKKMVLEAVEMYLRGDKAEPLGDTSKLTVEHIMPEKWQQNWSLPPDEDGIDDRDEAVKLIGNLTLTTAKLNTTLSNGPWDKKQKTLDNHSSLFLNKKLLKDAPDVWDETAIINRSSDLAKIIMEIWKSAETFLNP